MSTLLNNILAWAADNAWAMQLFAVVLTTLILGAAARRVVLFVKDHASKTANVLDDALFEALLGPTRGLIWVVGLSFAAYIAGEQTDAPIFDAVPAARSIGIVGAFTWFVLRFIRFYEGYYIAEQRQKKDRVDVTFVQAIGKLARAAVSITAVLIALQTVGINIAGLLAFGGMGGIAVGLAARDLIANVFGGVTIYLDRPFAVGDWIRSPDQEIEGDVEEIGWRRTVIRTFDKRPLYVPNAVFTTISVENPQRMWNRRIKETIGVRYDDLERVPAILADIRAYLNESPLIDQSRVLMVNFNQFGASSLDFFVYCFTRTVVWTEYHAVKEEVLLTIAAIISRHGGEIAFPTRTLHVPNELQIAGAVPRGATDEGAENPLRPAGNSSRPDPSRGTG